MYASVGLFQYPLFLMHEREPTLKPELVHNVPRLPGFYVGLVVVLNQPLHSEIGREGGERGGKGLVFGLGLNP